MYWRSQINTLKHLDIQMFLRHSHLIEKFSPMSWIDKFANKFLRRDARNETNTDAASANADSNGAKKGKKTRREKGSITTTN